MLPTKASRAAAHSDRDPRLINLLGGKIGQEAKLPATTLQAELIGDVISGPAGITAHGTVNRGNSHMPQFESPPKARRTVSKEELRKQAAAAFLQWRARRGSTP